MRSTCPGATPGRAKPRILSSAVLPDTSSLYGPTPGGGRRLRSLCGVPRGTGALEGSASRFGNEASGRASVITMAPERALASIDAMFEYSGASGERSARTRATARSKSPGRTGVPFE